jgi:hypothetical protein
LPPITGDDSDGDGVGNARDLCPGTTRGAVVDANGCPITTTAPVAPAPTSPTPTPAPAPSNPTPGACPGTDPFAGLVGLVGACVNGGWVPVPTTTTSPTPTPTLPPITGDDSDGDGVGNLRDLCPGTTRGVAVDANGCPVTTTAPIAPTPPTTSDSDGDGVPNTTDQCPGTAAGMPVDTRGCPIVSSSAPPPPSGNTIVLNPSVKYQTISGWEGAVIGSAQDYQALSDTQLRALLDIAVNDIGISRVRLPIRSGAENPGGSGSSYDIVNDNADPNVINPAGFQWTSIDYLIDRVIVPLRQRSQARGESLYVNLNYVDFGASAFEHYANPAEYAEFMLATFQHMQSKYGFVPNAIEVVLEPNDVNGWNPATMGQCIVATAQRLQAAGFTPDFIAPSTSNMGAAIPYIDGIMAVPGAAGLVKEFSYHRYGGSLEDLEAIAARGVQYGKGTSMLEYWSSDGNYRILHQDLTVGRNSAWQQGQVADSYGCQYNQILGWVNGAATVCPNTRFIRQYTKYVRPRAQRIDASSVNGTVEPVAFVNADGRYVVVVKSENGGSFSISGLPAGTYGIFYTTNAQYDVNLADATIAAGQSLSSNIPATGVITIYKK